MIALQQPPPAVTLTDYERDILAALKDGCCLKVIGLYLFLCNERLNYRRLVADDTILDTLLTAGLVAEAPAGVWTMKGGAE